MSKKMQDVVLMFTLVFGLIICASLFFNVLETSDNEPIMDGILAVFGGEVASIGGFISSRIIFSMRNFIAFIFPLIFSLLGIVIIKQSSAATIKLFAGIILSAVFVTSVYLLANLGLNTIGEVDVFGVTSKINYKQAELTIVSSVALVSAILGSVSSILYSVSQLGK